jgi:Homeodomain-like domain
VARAVSDLADLADLAVRSGEPAPALSAIVELRARLEELEELHVTAAREQGWSWSEIAAALGVTRQAAHKKYAGTSGASRNLDP